MRAAEARSRAANEEIIKALALRLPTASLEAAAGGETQRNSAYSGRHSGGAYSYALGLDMPLYQGGRDTAAIDAARADHRASLEAIADQRVATAYELALALLRIRQWREVIAALDRQNATLRKLHSDVNAEVKLGASSRVDLDDVSRQLAGIAVLRESARLAIAEAGQTVKRLGVSSDARIPDAATLGIGESEQALIAIAVANNPRIRYRAARVDAAAARIAEARGEMLPTITGGVRVGGEDASLPGVDQVHFGRAEMRLTLPFDLSGRMSANVQQKSEEKLAAQLDRDAAQGGVIAAVHSAFERRAQSRRMHKLAQNERRAAVAMLGGIRQERKVGERSTFDEIRAIENLANAEIKMANATYELRAAEYTLAAETGLIVQLLGASPQVASRGK